jgi:hypothetical protein
VNPFPVFVECGMFGKYTIPPRAVDERYSRIEITAREFKIDKGDDVFVDAVEPGINLANDMVSRNPGLGLIASEDNRGPTKDQIIRASEEMKVMDIERVQRGDALYDSTKNRSHVSGDCRQAAKRLGVLREWVDAGGDDRQLKKCRGCKELILPDAVVCKHCGWNQTLDPSSASTSAPPPLPPISKVEVQG